MAYLFASVALLIAVAAFLQSKLALDKIKEKKNTK